MNFAVQEVTAFCLILYFHNWLGLELCDCNQNLANNLCIIWQVQKLKTMWVIKFSFRTVLTGNLITYCGAADSSASDCPSYNRHKAWSVTLAAYCWAFNSVAGTNFFCDILLDVWSVVVWAADCSLLELFFYLYWVYHCK